MPIILIKSPPKIDNVFIIKCKKKAKNRIGRLLNEQIGAESP